MWAFFLNYPRTVIVAMMHAEFVVHHEECRGALHQLSFHWYCLDDKMLLQLPLRLCCTKMMQNLSMDRDLFVLGLMIVMHDDGEKSCPARNDDDGDLSCGFPVLLALFYNDDSVKKKRK